MVIALDLFFITVIETSEKLTLSFPTEVINLTTVKHCSIGKGENERICFLHLRKQRSRYAQLIRAFVFTTQIVQYLYFKNLKFQAFIFCGCTARIVSDMVTNPHDRFSHNAAHIEHLLQSYSFVLNLTNILLLFFIFQYFILLK